MGIDFGHDSLRVAVADLSYAILAERFAELEVDHAAEDALDTAAALVSELLEEAGVERGRVLGAGMGLPGPIDRESGLVHSQPILPGWVGLDPAAEMEERLGLPVHLDNDANLGALGESTFGAGRGTHVDGLPAPLRRASAPASCINGRPFRGARGIAGRDRPRAGRSPGPDLPLRQPRLPGDLRRRPRAVRAPAPRAWPPDRAPRSCSWPGRATPAAGACIADAGRVVGRAVADLCNVLNPDLVVVGGDLSAAGDLVLEPMREAVRPLRASRPPPRTSRSSPARSATAPRCSARSPSPATSPKTH